MNDATVAVTSLIIFVSAILIMVPLKQPSWWHFEKNPSEEQWRLGRTMFFAFVIAFVSGLMAFSAMGFFEPEP